MCLSDKDVSSTDLTLLTWSTKSGSWALYSLTMWVQIKSTLSNIWWLLLRFVGVCPRVTEPICKRNFRQFMLTDNIWVNSLWPFSSFIWSLVWHNRSCCRGDAGNILPYLKHTFVSIESVWCLSLLVCVWPQYFLYLAWYMTMSVLGHYNNFFFAAHLLDIAMGFKTLRTILSSVTHNGKQVCVWRSILFLHPCLCWVWRGCVLSCHMVIMGHF